MSNPTTPTDPIALETIASPALQRAPRRRRVVLIAALVAPALVALLLFALAFARPQSAQARPSQSATLIVQFDDNARMVRPIEFSSAISGIRALQLAGVQVVTSSTGFGPAVCAIEGVGCPTEDCFCAGNHYWGNSYFDGSQWHSYAVGAGSTVISQTGAIEGWRWGEWGDTLTDPARSLAAQRALATIAASQSITTGGIGAPNANMGSSVEAMLALGANRESAGDLRRSASAPSLEDFNALHGAAYAAGSAAASGKLAVATLTVDACLPAGSPAPSGFYSPTTGIFGSSMGDHAWAILGAVARQEALPAAALDRLADAQLADGSWEWSTGWGGDTNTTSLAVQALVSGGEAVSSTAVLAALNWLDSVQLADGGFPYAPGSGATSDANSTAYVLQALIATGEEITGARWSVGGKSAVDRLLALQLPDGRFEWQSGSGASELATLQAIPALLGRHFPATMSSATLVESCDGPYLPWVLRSAESAE